jgi:hypothetical protein
MYSGERKLGLGWVAFYLFIVTGALWMCVWAPLWAFFGPKGAP